MSIVIVLHRFPKSKPCYQKIFWGKIREAHRFIASRPSWRFVLRYGTTVEPKVHHHQDTVDKRCPPPPPGTPETSKKLRGRNKISVGGICYCGFGYCVYGFTHHDSLVSLCSSCDGAPCPSILAEGQNKAVFCWGIPRNTT